MALSATQKQENRKDFAAGKPPRHMSDALTAVDGSIVDGTYGAEEIAVIGNNRLRIGQTAQGLVDLGLLSST